MRANDTIRFPGLLKTRSRDAFAELYDKYSGAFYSIICRMITNANVAEELLQDVFIKVWKNIDKYDPSKGSLFTWMLQISRNTCIDYLRTRGRERERWYIGLPLAAVGGLGAAAIARRGRRAE